MVACLKEEGKMPVVSDRLKRWVRAGIITSVTLGMRWDGIGSRGHVVRWDFESSFESFSLVIGEKPVMGEQHCAGM